MTKISEELMIKFLNKECTTDELSIIERWINESPDNAKDLFELEYTAYLASGLSEDRESHNRVALNVRSRIASFKAMQRRRNSFRILRWSAAAILVGVVVAVSIMLLNKGTEMITVDSYAESKMIILPDSTKVWLNQYATLSYPKVYSDKSREITLNGEAYFEVTKDSARPFKVMGDHLIVQVLGTKFNFSSSPKKENIVSLIEGMVEVTSKTNDDGIVITPGQRVIFNPENNRIRVDEANASLDAVWHNGLIPFHNSTITEIVSDLESLYGVDITVRHSVDLTATYSGASQKYESIDSTLDALCNTLPIQYTRNGNHIIISRKKSE